MQDPDNVDPEESDTESEPLLPEVLEYERIRRQAIQDGKRRQVLPDESPVNVTAGEPTVRDFGAWDPNVPARPISPEAEARILAAHGKKKKRVQFALPQAEKERATGTYSNLVDTIMIVKPLLGMEKQVRYRHSSSSTFLLSPFPFLAWRTSRPSPFVRWRSFYIPSLLPLS